MGISKKELSLIREIVPNKGMGITRARAREATFKAPSPSFGIGDMVATKQRQTATPSDKWRQPKLKGKA